jgi:hypothetical protein
MTSINHEVNSTVQDICLSCNSCIQVLYSHLQPHVQLAKSQLQPIFQLVSSINHNAPWRFRSWLRIKLILTLLEISKPDKNNTQLKNLSKQYSIKYHFLHWIFSTRNISTHSLKDSKVLQFFQRNIYCGFMGIYSMLAFVEDACTVFSFWQPYVFT